MSTSEANNGLNRIFNEAPKLKGNQITRLLTSPGNNPKVAMGLYRYLLTEISENPPVTDGYVIKKNKVNDFIEEMVEIHETQNNIKNIPAPNSLRPLSAARRSELRDRRRAAVRRRKVQRQAQ